MAAAEPKLDLITLDTHNTYSIAIGDISSYPTGYNIMNQSIEITPPGFNKVILGFEEKNVNVYNSYNLGLCAENMITSTPLPDGIYRVKYSIHPVYKYYVEKTFLKVDILQQKFDKAFLKSDITECDSDMRSKDFKVLREINFNLQGAIAAANSCADKLSMELYRKANKQLDNFITNRCDSC
jgi:hypothetical protein